MSRGEGRVGGKEPGCIACRGLVFGGQPTPTRALPSVAEMDGEDADLQVLDFPHYGTLLLEHLNKHRLEGKFCDITVHVQQCTFQAHKAVLAASSRYFHDQLLLKDSSTLLLPDLLNPVVFERVLVSAYTGRLFLSMEDISSYLTVASFLQMWHVVDKCNEFIRKGFHIAKAQSSRSSDTQSPSSSHFFSSKDVGDSWASDHSRSGVSVREEVEATTENYQHTVENCFSVKAVCEHEGVSQPEACTFTGVTLSQNLPKPCIKQEDLVADHVESIADKEGPLMLGAPMDQFIGEIQTVAGIDFLVEPEEVLFIPSCAPTVLTNPTSAEEADDSSSTVHRPLGHLPHGPVEHTSRFGKKVFGCLCGKRFPEKGRRDRHVMLRISMRPFSCSLCNKKFKMKHHLGEHMLVHMDRPVYECSTCCKKFKLIEYFQKHSENCEKLGSSGERD
ncbi:zinc finger and BTB domain-containing protein 43-like [Ambystoma mexicanum]|uniref:zinc finger and BTB domain-containing protein 43-like n=1 Tax=Ambystoma mexicanum TaxID=8296 RepID=UPI0037E8FA8A